MDASTFDKTILVPGINWFLANAPEVPVKRDAHLLLLAITGQESAWTHRLQEPVAYAKGFWQYEKNGGVKGVLTHPATRLIAKRLCDNYNIDATPLAVWNVLGTAHGDNLAVAFARLLLFSDPAPLPAVGDIDGSYKYYIRCWRPGRPSATRWHDVYRKAVEATK